jgi:glutathione S-transferase
MKSNITLYVNPITVNSIKVILLCDALGIKPNYITIELHKGEQRTPAFLTINPDGKVPVLVDGDYVLNESNAILQYLSNKSSNKHQSYWPSDKKQQAEVLKWLFWQGNKWGKAVGIFTHRRLVLPHFGFNNKEGVSQEHINDFHQIIRRLEQALTDKKFLVGNSLTIADICLSSYLILSDEAEIPIDDYVHVRRWLARLNEMPWWQETHQSLVKIFNDRSEQLLV